SCAFRHNRLPAAKERASTTVGTAERICFILRGSLPAWPACGWVVRMVCGACGVFGIATDVVQGRASSLMGRKAPIKVWLKTGDRKVRTLRRDSTLFTDDRGRIPWFRLGGAFRNLLTLPARLGQYRSPKAITSFLHQQLTRRLPSGNAQRLSCATQVPQGVDAVMDCPTPKSHFPPQPAYPGSAHLSAVVRAATRR